MIERRAAATAARPCPRPGPGSPPSSFPQVTCLDRSGRPVLPPLSACEMRGRPALAVLAWSGDGSPVWGCTTTSRDQVPLGHMGVEVPRDTSPGIRWVPASKATPPRERLSIPARAMRSHRRGENVVTITSIQPRSTSSARAMVHSARDLQTRLRIDLAIPIGSAIEPVPHAHVQVTADRRPGSGSGVCCSPRKKSRS
jgi:hypothetical protein